MDPIYWSLILIGMGLGVILLELFIPSAGLLGILAATFLIAGIVTAFFQSMMTGLIVLLLTSLLLPALFALLIKIWPHTPIGRRILLGPATHDEVMPTGETYTRYAELVGQLGVAKSKMLPSGLIVVNDKKYDAVSDGFPIEAGQPVKVTAIRANRIFVEPYDGDVTDVEDLPARDRDVFSQSLEELGIEPLDDPLEQ